MDTRRWQTWMRIPIHLALVASLLLSGRVVTARSAMSGGTFVETFDTTTYQAYVTDVVWDTQAGELRLEAKEHPQRSPVVVGGWEDRTFVAWWDARASTARLYYQWFDSGGSPLLPQGLWFTGGTLENDNVLYEIFAPAAAATPEGDAVVAWPARVSGKYYIFVQKISPMDGEQWQTAKSVRSSGSTEPLFKPSIDVGNDGGIIVSWIMGEYHAYAAVSHAYVQRFTPSGVRQFGDGRQVDQTTGEADATYPYDIEVAVMDDTNILVGMLATYENYSDHPVVLLQKLNSVGVAQWENDHFIGRGTDKYRCLGNLRSSALENTAVFSFLNDDISEIDYVRYKTDGTLMYLGSFSEISADHTMVIDTDGYLWFAFSDAPGWGVQGLDPTNKPLDYGKFVVIASNGWCREGALAVTQPSHTLSAAYVKDNVLWMNRFRWDDELLWTEPLHVATTQLFLSPEGWAASKTVNGGRWVSSALLTAETVLNSGSVSFELSNDGGISWVPSKSGFQVDFPAPGTDLRWRVHLRSSGTKTPFIYRVEINYFPPELSHKFYLPTVQR